MATNSQLHTPLQQQIDVFIAEGASWLPADLLRNLLSPIRQLVNSGATEHAFKEGMQVPDFTLPDAGGHALWLTHLLKEVPVVMMFYRVAWCPLLPSGAARLSAGVAQAPGTGSYPRGDFAADAGPQPRPGRKAGSDLSPLE